MIHHYYLILSSCNKRGYIVVWKYRFIVLFRIIFHIMSKKKLKKTTTTTNPNKLKIKIRTTTNQKITSLDYFLLLFNLLFFFLFSFSLYFLILSFQNKIKNHSLMRTGHNQSSSFLLLLWFGSEFLDIDHQELAMDRRQRHQPVDASFSTRRRRVMLVEDDDAREADDRLLSHERHAVSEDVGLDDPLHDRLPHRVLVVDDVLILINIIIFLPTSMLLMTTTTMVEEIRRRMCPDEMRQHEDANDGQSSR